MRKLLFRSLFCGRDLADLHVLHFDVGVAPEHEHVHLRLLRRVVQLLDLADKARKRACVDAHVVAHRKVCVDGDRFELHLAHLFVFERQRAALRADKPGDAARVGDEVPHLVRVDHLDEDVARQQLALDHLLFAVLLLDGLLHQDLQVKNIVFEIVVFDQLFQAVFDHHLIPRIGMKDVPLGLAFERISRMFHNSSSQMCPRRRACAAPGSALCGGAAAEAAAQQAEQRVETIVDGGKYDQKRKYDDEHDARRFDHLPEGGPGHLFDLGKYFFDLSSHPNENVRLFSSCLRFHEDLAMILSRLRRFPLSKGNYLDSL